MTLAGPGWRARVGRWLPLGLILLGVLVRLVAFGAVPAGFNQDEAFAGYEAYSLLTYGVDSWGYPFPCYFISWGSGMNVLESYLAIPFVALLGPTEAAVRLPQLLCACLSMPVFYDLLRRMISRRAALIGLGLLAISPWHILLSRWGLESNLAPAFLLFGFYFLVRALEDSRFLLASAAAYGVSLYAYAITWAVVPLTLCGWGAYLLLSGRRFPLRHLLPAVGLLFLLALPLLLFLLVNLNVIDEIVTPWFSAPKLSAMRGGDLSWRNLFSTHSYWDLGNVIFLQRDFLPWNAMEGFGMFYPISLPFQLLGTVRLVRGAAEALRARRVCWECLVLLGALGAVLIGLMFYDVSINRVNALHFYTLVFITAGVDELFRLCRRLRLVPALTAAAYACCFLAFAGVYFTSYNDETALHFRQGVGQAVGFVKQQGFDRVAVDDSVYYSQILFYDQTPHEVYAASVDYAGGPAAFLDVAGFGRYTFGIDYGALEGDTAYLIPAGRAGELAAAGYQTVVFDGYAVAWQEGSVSTHEELALSF